jgi:hypothetical protein
VTLLAALYKRFMFGGVPNFIPQLSKDPIWFLNFGL